MATKFHINPVKGPLVCVAPPGKCKYGTDAPHFNSKTEATEAYNDFLEKSNEAFASLRKPKRVVKNVRTITKTAAFTPALRKLDAKLEEFTSEQLDEFASSSKRNHTLLNNLIEARASEAPQLYRMMTMVSKGSDHPISYKNYRSIERDFDAYRNQTAMMVESHIKSPFYTSPTKDLDDDSTVGEAVQVAEYAHTDPRWYSSRFNSIGGSEVGALVLQKYVPEEKQTSFDKFYVKKTEASKIDPPTKDNLAKEIDVFNNVKTGALYRGTVWEDRIRDDFAKEYPELTVYNVKKQYCDKDREWQRVNFDGVLSDRKDGKPNGILEIKTGGVPEKWDNGIPDSYRAQALYYLSATKLDFVVVRVLLNDGIYKDYQLNAHDDVYPGCGKSMPDFVKEDVEPWFEDLKSRREPLEKTS